MATRKIIKINEELCNGCGDCIIGCAEGALQIVDGKAKLVREDFCDGFGDCVGTCPTGALTIVESDAPEYDPSATREHVGRTRGAQGLEEFDRAASRHDEHQATPVGIQNGPKPGGGCPGSRMRVFPTAGGGVSPSSPNPSFVSGTPAPNSSPGTLSASGDPGTVIPSNIGQWPIQLHLVQPHAPFFKDKELCVLSTCAPVAMPDAQWRYVRGRSLVVACPKLDRTEGYVEKLAAILTESSIPRAVIVRMEVPCCSGLTRMVTEAAKLSGRDDLTVVEANVSVDGQHLGETVVFG